MKMADICGHNNTEKKKEKFENSSKSLNTLQNVNGNNKNISEDEEKYLLENYSNFFETYKNIGRNIDKRIEKLENSWILLNTLLSDNGKNDDDTSEHVEKFLLEIVDINNQVVADTEPRKRQIEETRIFLNTYRNTCDNLTEECNNMELFLIENGYIPNPTVIKQETPMENSILSEDQMNNLTLDSPVQPKVKSESESVPSNSDLPKFIATPVIKTVASVLPRETVPKPTPRRDYPQEPIFSPYYYQKR